MTFFAPVLLALRLAARKSEIERETPNIRFWVIYFPVQISKFCFFLIFEGALYRVFLASVILKFFVVYQPWWPTFLLSTPPLLPPSPHPKKASYLAFDIWAFTNLVSRAINHTKIKWKIHTLFTLNFFMLWSFLQKCVRQNHQVFYFFCSFYISRYHCSQIVRTLFKKF